jgi:diketogulonate reductase-like aldo/keto reductase
MVESNTYLLNNGQTMPKVGFGSSHTESSDIIKTAVLESGYRMIDTGSFYKNEADIGAALKEIFDSGKV